MSRFSSRRSRLLGMFLALLLLAGCSPAPAASSGSAPASEEMASLSLCFASGAGAWSTGLTLYEDGSFVGDFHDTNMGEAGNNYPNGTVYFTQFRGRFVSAGHSSPNVHLLNLDALEDLYEDTRPFIEQGIRFVPSAPYGLEDGRQFILYPPETPVKDLPEEFLSWWPLRFEEDPPETLSVYGLYNVEMGYGFFS